LPSDDYFSVQVDVYLPAGSATQEQRAGIFVFNDPDPGLSFGTHGLLSTLQNSGAGSSALRWWVYPLANPPDAFNATSVVTFLPDQWHTLRVEGQRSLCRFRTLVDGVELGIWGGACDTAGAMMSVYSRNDAVQPTAVAWSNLRIFGGTDFPCVP
jgi:hypothetical protein